MRDFDAISAELGLVRFLESEHGDLYCVPVAPGAARILVRRFNRELPAALIPVYARLAAAAQAWITRDPELAALVSVDQPSEIGRDFLARPHRIGNSLGSYADDEDPPDPPDELAPMQARFRALAVKAAGERDQLLVRILTRSLLEPTAKTMYDTRGERFVVAELKPTRDELERWAALDA